jgi:hypothetical protein
LDRVLLSLPALYRTRLVNYETNLDAAKVALLISRVQQIRTLAGDLVECGSSRAGSAAIMAETLRKLGLSKTIFACDSFRGFNRRELEAERRAGLTQAADGAFTSTSVSYVTRKLEVLGLADIVRLIPGYFEDTLPSLDSEFCLAFIDCDLRESVAYCARELWPRVVPGGQLLVDDYGASGWKGATLGVRDFLDGDPPDVDAHQEECGMYSIVKTA